MPKEILETFSGNKDYKGPPVAVQLTWSKDSGNVQIATINLSVEDGDDPFEIAGGWFVDLDRRTINKLIRHLRRARDHSDPEGKDE